MNETQSAPLCGVVLAGGEARRMGRDKGALDYHGEPQARHCWRLLEALGVEAFVSVRRDREQTPPYASLPLLVDRGSVGGPAAGLIAAFEHNDASAWLLWAVDMPLVDRDALERLIRARDPAVFATAFVHPDGTPEPLCTIWEPAARAPLLARARRGRASLRRLLETLPVRLVEPADAVALTSADSAEDYQRACRTLAGASGRSARKEGDV
jgi:molybdopterin-guanine dinucleotide biosynthesis protein A